MSFVGQASVNKGLIVGIHISYVHVLYTSSSLNTFKGKLKALFLDKVVFDQDSIQHEQVLLGKEDVCRKFTHLCSIK